MVVKYKQSKENMPHRKENPPSSQNSPEENNNKLGYSISEGHIATTELAEDYLALHAPLLEVISKFPTAINTIPRTLDREFKRDLPSQINYFERFVKSEVREGAEERLQKTTVRWEKLTQDVDDMDQMYQNMIAILEDQYQANKPAGNYSSEDQKIPDITKEMEEYIRLSAWSLKFSMRITEATTALEFLAGIRAW